MIDFIEYDRIEIEILTWGLAHSITAPLSRSQLDQEVSRRILGLGFFRVFQHGNWTTSHQFAGKVHWNVRFSRAFKAPDDFIRNEKFYTIGSGDFRDDASVEFGEPETEFPYWHGILTQMEGARRQGAISLRVLKADKEARPQEGRYDVYGVTLMSGTQNYFKEHLFPDPLRKSEDDN